MYQFKFTHSVLSLGTRLVRYMVKFSPLYSSFILLNRCWISHLRGSLVNLVVPTNDLAMIDAT